MKFELGKQVLLLVGTAYREVVITGRAQYLRGADQYLVEDLDPESQRGAFWVEEPGLQAKAADASTAPAPAQATDPEADRNRLTRDLWVRHGLDYYDPKTHSLVRTSGGRVDFKDAPRDWRVPKDAKPTSRGFYIGDRVIHPHYGGGIVTDNVNGHTEVRFYEQDVRTVFIGVRNDELKLASIGEASEAYPSEAALVEKAVRDAVADGLTVGLGKAVDRILKEQRGATAPSEDAADAESLSLVGDRIFGELARFDQVEGFAERVIGVFAKEGYSMNISFHKPDPTPEVASLAPSS